jgi:hypothetical protein
VEQKNKPVSLHVYDLGLLPREVRTLRKQAGVVYCVQINQCVGSRRRVDGVEVDATIQHERAVKF